MFLVESSISNLIALKMQSISPASSAPLRAIFSYFFAVQGETAMNN